MLDDLSALQQLPAVTLDTNILRHDANGKCQLDVTLTNPTKVVALMAHLQLRKQGIQDASAARVLPVFYSDNYISLLPGESRTTTIEADAKLLDGKEPLVTVDGWNTTTKSKSFSSRSGVSFLAQLESFGRSRTGAASIAPNTEALVLSKTAAR